MPPVQARTGAAPRLLRDDSGVIAVITAIVVASVLVPVAALGLTSYVRTASRQELQRATESGALAGASSLVLLNIGTLAVDDLVNPVVDISAVVPPDLPDPLGSTGRACRAAHTAYGQPLSDPTRDPSDRSPVSASFASGPGCDARYSPDPTFSTCVNEVYTAVRTVTGSVTSELDALLAAVTANPLLAPLAGDVGSTRAIVRTVQDLVPAVTHNGVQVEMTADVEGPLDAVLLSNGPTTTTTTAAARRLFKPLIPDFAGLLALTEEQAEDLLESEELAEALEDLPLDRAVSRTERLVVAMLQTVVRVLRYLVSDHDPDDDEDLELTDVMPYVQATLDAAEDRLRDEAGALLPLLEPVLTPLGSPSIPPSATISDPCRQATREILDDLAFALTVNRDEDEQDLIPCTVQQVLGHADPLAAVAPTSGCVNRVFRAQLAPTT